MFIFLNNLQACFRPKIEVLEDDDDEDIDLSTQADGQAPFSVSMTGNKPASQSSTGIVIEDITDQAKDSTTSDHGGLVKSHKLLSELQDVADCSIVKKGEINMSEPIDRELIHKKEKTREEKIMELAATVGSTVDRPSVPFDEDLEGLD